MNFPSAAPELPVICVAKAGEYYQKCLGFSWDWGTQGLGQVSRGGCRFFLTDNAFRGAESTGTPVIIWINLDSKDEVDALHNTWRAAGAHIVTEPESKPWNLHEFIASDLDGNRLRVFYDFAWELRDQKHQKDDSDDRMQAPAAQ